MVVVCHLHADSGKEDERPSRAAPSRALHEQRHQHGRDGAALKTLTQSDKLNATELLHEAESLVGANQRNKQGKRRDKR